MYRNPASDDDDNDGPDPEPRGLLSQRSALVLLLAVMTSAMTVLLLLLAQASHVTVVTIGLATLGAAIVFWDRALGR